MLSCFSLTTTSSAVPGTVLHPLLGENCCACVDDRSTARNCTRRFSAAYGFCGIKGCDLPMPTTSKVCAGMPCLATMYCFTAAARRCERRRLYSKPPTASVCPSTTMRLLPPAILLPSATASSAATMSGWISAELNGNCTWSATALVLSIRSALPIGSGSDSLRRPSKAGGGVSVSNRKPRVLVLESAGACGAPNILAMSFGSGVTPCRYKITSPARPAPLIELSAASARNINAGRLAEFMIVVPLYCRSEPGATRCVAEHRTVGKVRCVGCRLGVTRSFREEVLLVADVKNYRCTQRGVRGRTQ